MRTLLTAFSGARAFCVVALPLAVVLSGCTSGSSDSVTVDGDVPIAYVKRPVTAIGNPTEAYTFSPGGDLYIRDQSSPSASETNITTAYTQGQGDVSDPEVSYDGTRLLFSMRRPTDSYWRVWEYDIAKKTMTQIPCTVASGTTPQGDDVDPAYLPDGRIVFVSNRQVGSNRHMTEENPSQTPFPYLDEYDRQRSTTLHVMNADGQQCHQISFNQSHDRNPTVLQNGLIMYSRWDHVGTRNQFTIFTTNPDGTELFVEYGAHSGVNSYLHPREMPDGKVLSDAMPLSRTHEGGALLMVDAKNYSENDEAAPGVTGGSGQSQATAQNVTFGGGLSPYGRFTTPYPLWDGTNRALVVWTPSCLATQGPGKPNGDCVMQTDAVSGQQVVDDRATMPTYGIYMLDLSTKAMRPVVTYTPGYAVTDPVAIQPRPLPNVIADKALNATLASATSQLNTTGVGILDVQSVYDTDDKQRMGDSVLVAGIGETIPKVLSVPANPAPNQCYVNRVYVSNGKQVHTADICKLKDPAQTTADKRPARFVRVTRAIPTQSGISRAAIGETDFEMQQILGYVPVEPDGSFKIEVPAEIPLGLTVIDSAGRGFQTHTSWIQVRPGEVRTCHGCHSPRRDDAINIAPNVAGYHSNVQATMAAMGGENMATTHERVSGGTSRQLQPNLVFNDVWTDPAAPAVMAAAAAGIRPSPPALDPSLTIDYTGLTTPAPANGVIDYEANIAPLWTKTRTLPGGGTGDCTTCHDGSGSGVGGRHALNLRSTNAGTGRLASYDSLMIGDPVLNAQGQPLLRSDGEEIRVVRSDPQVTPGLARGSHLVEVLFNQQLKSSYALGTTDHSSMLNASEKRLVSEWIDVGAQYYNTPRDSAGNLRGVTGLDRTVFDNSIHTVLINRCGSCHVPAGIAGAAPTAGFTALRYVLTGDPEGDYNVTLSMIGDTANPGATQLLSRPRSTGTSPNPIHPQIPPAGGGAAGPVFPTAADPDYLTVCHWINSAGPCP